MLILAFILWILCVALGIHFAHEIGWPGWVGALFGFFGHVLGVLILVVVEVIQKNETAIK